MKLPRPSSLSLLLLLLAAPLCARAQMQTPDYFFLTGATNYLRTNVDAAKRFVSNGLSLYPTDPKLTNLWALLNRNGQGGQSQQENKNDEQKSEQQKSEEQKSEQPQKDEQKPDGGQKKEEDKKDEQEGAQNKRGKEPGDSGDPQSGGRAVAMTPRQAQQLLDMQKSEERPMIFQPENLRTNRPRDRVFKDW
jgi:hypothetical protein